MACSYCNINLGDGIRIFSDRGVCCRCEKIAYRNTILRGTYCGHVIKDNRAYELFQIDDDMVKTCDCGMVIQYFTVVCKGNWFDSFIDCLDSIVSKEGDLLLDKNDHDD